MTLKAWKASLKAGMTLRCVYRWYWERTPDKRPESGEQSCTIVEVRATQMIYSEGKNPRCFMDYPLARDLKHIDGGFELYWPNDPKHRELAGKLMSRYLYA